MESESAERTEWFAAQNAYTRRVLSSLPGRDRLLRELREANRLTERIQLLRVVGDEPRIFALRRGANDETFKLVVRYGWRGTERVLVDPNGDTSHAAIDRAFPSPDGRHVAYVISNAGSEDGTLRIIEVDSGNVLPDSIDREPRRVYWRSDGRSFYYWRRAKPQPDPKPTDRYKHSAIYLHVIGKDPDKEVPVLAAGNAQLDIRPDDLPWVETALQSSWALAGATSGTGDPAYFVTPLRKAEPGKTTWRGVATRDDKVENVIIHKDRLYAFTYAGSPNYSIVSFAAKSGSLARATTFVPASDLVLVDFAAASDGMYVVARDRGLSRLFRVSWGTAARKEITLPFEGSINQLLASPDRPGLLVNMEGWTRPPAWLQVAPDATVQDLAMSAPTPAIDGLIAEQATVESHDGAEVPLSIIRRQDQKLDGSAPAILSGYGAYGISTNPAYSPFSLTWARLGGVYAICHVRGGGERGKSWHLAGIKQKKENGVLDFISCAEHLIKQGYTKTTRLTAFGGSAGGILIGGAATRRPDLFAAIAVRVGQLNPLRKEVTEGGAINADEYGNVRVEAEFRSLLASDPYHRIRDGVTYPAAILTTGMHDPRVSPWVPGKFAARLQAASRQPTLLRLDPNDGHGFTSTQTQREEEYADIYSFALWRSGVQPR